MFCYRDRCYCQFYIDCELGVTCDDALTPEVRERAKKVNLPIQCRIDKPVCFREKFDGDTAA